MRWISRSPTGRSPTSRSPMGRSPTRSLAELGRFRGRCRRWRATRVAARCVCSQWSALPTQTGCSHASRISGCTRQSARLCTSTSALVAARTMSLAGRLVLGTGSKHPSKTKKQPSTKGITSPGAGRGAMPIRVRSGYGSRSQVRNFYPSTSRVTRQAAAVASVTGRCTVRAQLGVRRLRIVRVGGPAVRLQLINVGLICLPQKSRAHRRSGHLMPRRIPRPPPTSQGRHGDRRVERGAPLGLDVRMAVHAVATAAATTVAALLRGQLRKDGVASDWVSVGQ